MKKSAGKFLLLSVILFLYFPNLNAQDDAASLKGIKKLIFKVSWSGNVSPYDIGVNADSLFTDMNFNLTEGSLLEEVIDGRGIDANTQSIPQLLVDVQIKTFLDKYIFYFISVGLLEHVQTVRLVDQSFSSIIWLNQNYDVSEKDIAGENLKKLLTDLHWSFINAYNKDNGLD